MDFLNIGMQLVGRHKLFLYALQHFVSELLQKLFLAKNWEWAWLFSAGEHSQH